MKELHNPAWFSQVIAGEDNTQYILLEILLWRGYPVVQRNGELFLCRDRSGQLDQEGDAKVLQECGISVERLPKERDYFGKLGIMSYAGDSWKKVFSLQGWGICPDVHKIRVDQLDPAVALVAEAICLHGVQVLEASAGSWTPEVNIEGFIESSHRGLGLKPVKDLIEGAWKEQERFPYLNDLKSYMELKWESDGEDKKESGYHTMWFKDVVSYQDAFSLVRLGKWLLSVKAGGPISERQAEEFSALESHAAGHTH
jgi:hypothetical protein